MRKAGKRITHSFFVQPVTRGSGKFPAYSERQVSRLIHLHLCRLPALPVAYWHKLRNYGDEFAQDFHLFPFSPKPTEVALTPSVSYSIRHILPQYRAFCNKKEPGTLREPGSSSVPGSQSVPGTKLFLFDNLYPAFGSFDFASLNACKCIVNLLCPGTHFFHA